MAEKKNTAKKNTTNKKNVATKKVEEKVVEKEEIKEEVSKSNSKTTILVVAILIVALIAIIVSANNESKNKKTSESMELTEITCDNETDSIKQDEESKMKKISCNGYEEMVKEKKDNLILIARPTCGYCVKFIPILEEILGEYPDLTITYFDTDSLSENESSQFYKSSSLYSGGQFGTPTLIVTNNNKIKNYTIGYKEKDATIDWLKEAGFIK